MYNNPYRSAIKNDIEKKPFLTANFIIVYFNKTLCLFNALRFASGEHMVKTNFDHLKMVIMRIRILEN